MRSNSRPELHIYITPKTFSTKACVVTGKKPRRNGAVNA